jgi:hypothetical protein
MFSGGLRRHCPEVGLGEMSCHAVLFALPISSKPVSGQSVDIGTLGDK